MGLLGLAFQNINAAMTSHEVNRVVDPETGVVVRETWYRSRDEVFHMDRSGAPAYTRRDWKTGSVTAEAWFKDGVRHRIGGPAITMHDEKTGAITKQEWWEYGKAIAPKTTSGPAAQAAKPKF